MKKCLNVKAVKAVNVAVTPPSLMVCLHDVLIKDVNLVVFLESISNQVMISLFGLSSSPSESKY